VLIRPKIIERLERMRIVENCPGTKIWASKDNTYDWAHRAGNSWPCSDLSDKRVFVELSHNGDLVDMSINGGHGDQDVAIHELNAFIEDALKGRE
jgi:hypothetical protein